MTERKSDSAKPSNQRDLNQGDGVEPVPKSPKSKKGTEAESEPEIISNNSPGTKPGTIAQSSENDQSSSGVSSSKESTTATGDDYCLNFKPTMLLDMKQVCTEKAGKRKFQRYASESSESASDSDTSLDQIIAHAKSLAKRRTNTANKRAKKTKNDKSKPARREP